MEIVVKRIPDAIREYMTGCKIRSITDRGIWIHHHYEVVLDNGMTVFFKVGEKPEWSDVKHEADVTKFFIANDLPVPRTLAVDTSASILPYPYIIQEKIGGTRLCNLLNQVNSEEQPSIYEVIGKLYRKIHNIKNARSGLWGDSPRTIRYPISPTDYMFHAEIIDGSGKKALLEGRISQRTYQRIVTYWQDNLDYLKNHQPSLIHFSPFLWNIYLDKTDNEWQVTKLMALSDVMWWDAACDLAELQYPSFGEFNKANWDAFLKGYGTIPDRKRILLYAVLQRLCAVMGIYMAPKMEGNEAWAEQRISDVESYLNDIESL